MDIPLNARVQQNLTRGRKEIWTYIGDDRWRSSKNDIAEPSNTTDLTIHLGDAYAYGSSEKGVFVRLD